MILVALLFLSGAASAQPDQVQIADTPLTLTCQYCQALVSQGGGIFGHTAALMDLHVISSASDVAFPRALQARLESECSSCQPAAFVAQARGLSPLSTVWAANFEAYSQGRASVAEFNIGAANGGYVFDVVPVRMPDGTPSQIDAVIKVEGQNGDSGAVQIGAILDIRVNPTQAIIIVPADQGPITVLRTADGRLEERLIPPHDGVSWTREIVVDGAVQK